MVEGLIYIVRVGHSLVPLLQWVEQFHCNCDLVRQATGGLKIIK